MLRSRADGPAVIDGGLPGRCLVLTLLCGDEPFRQLAPLAGGLGLGRVGGHRDGDMVGAGVQLP